MKPTPKDVIFIAIIAILSIFLYFKKGKTIVKEFEKEVINRTKIDSLLSAEKVKSDSILVLKNKVVDLENQSNILQVKINNKEKKLKSLEREYSKKDSVVSNYNVVELEQFFTDRYK